MAYLPRKGDGFPTSCEGVAAQSERTFHLPKASHRGSSRSLAHHKFHILLIRQSTLLQSASAAVSDDTRVDRPPVNSALGHGSIRSQLDQLVCLSCSRGTNRLAPIGFRLTRRTTCCPCTRVSQASGLTSSGTEGREGRRGAAIRGGRWPQAIRFQRSLPVVVGGKSFSHLADFIQGFGTRRRKALLSERAMIAFDTPILVWVMRIAEKHADPQRLTKARPLQQESRCLVALRPNACRGPGESKQASRVRRRGVRGLRGAVSAVKSERT